MTDSNLKGSYDGMTENKHTLNDAISLMGDITQFSTRDKSNTVNTNSSQLVASTQYDVKKYGAIGDGITNDTKAIQNAINAANNKGGGTIYFPCGTYLTDTLTIYSNITLYGENKWKSILQLVISPTGALLECSGTPSAQKENICITNLYLKHIKTFTKAGDIKGVLIRGYDTRFCEVVDCIFSQCSVHGIMLSNIDNNYTYAMSWIIDKCIFYDFTKCNTNGIFLYNQAEYVQISNCVFYMLSTAVQLINSANIKITNSTFLKCGYTNNPTINIDSNNSFNGGKILVANNSINHNDYTAIKITHSGGTRVEYGNKIIGNDILVNELHTQIPIILIGVTGTIVTGNKISGQNTVNPISITDNGAVAADYNIITENILLYGTITNTSSGIYNIIDRNIENAPQ